MALLDNSRNALNDSVGALQNLFKGYRDTNQANFLNSQQNQAADYLDQVAQARTPEELAALRNNTDVQALRQGLTAQFRNQTRGAIDKREIALIDQIGKRQTFQDGQWTRDHADALAGIETLAINGNLDAAISKAQELGAPDPRALVQGLRDSYNTSADQRIQEDGNARAWNSDRRSEATHQFSQYTRNRTKDQNATSDTLDGIFANAAQALETAPDSTTATDILRGAQEAALQAGGTVQDVNARLAGLDKAMAARTGTSQVDTQGNTMEMSQLDKKYNANQNEFIVTGPMGNPADEANKVLQEFTVDGKLMGNDNPDWRAKVARQSAQVLRSGVTVDGTHYDVTPSILRSALQDVDEQGFDWDTTTKDAVKYYIKKSDGLKKKAEDARAYYQELKALEAKQAKRTLSPYYQKRMSQPKNAQ